MFTFDYGDKIYAAWDPDQKPVWDANDAFDAGPDGISGKKEGFYFGNWLMPFSPTFRFSGVAISMVDYPGCIENDPFPCSTCLFFKPETCPLLMDKSNFELTRKGFNLYKKIVYCPRGGDSTIFDVAQKELLSHGRPLHYQVLAKILINRYPQMKITNRKLFKILRVNPIFFQDIGEGAFQAKQGVKKGGNTAIDIVLLEALNR